MHCLGHTLPDYLCGDFHSFEVFYSSVNCKNLMAIMQIDFVYEHANDFCPEERGPSHTKKIIKINKDNPVCLHLQVHFNISDL